MQSVFVAGPFKGLVDPQTGVVPAGARAALNGVIEHFEHRGYRIFNAHRREHWGARMLEPEACTRLDFEEISACDLFVAFPGAPASPGTHVEIGWATALGKRIVLFLEAGRAHAHLVTGLGSIAEVAYVSYVDAADLLAKLAALAL